MSALVILIPILTYLVFADISDRKSNRLTREQKWLRGDFGCYLL